MSSTTMVGDGLCACGCGGTTRLVAPGKVAKRFAGRPRLYITGHNMRGRTRPDKRRPLAEAFWSKVDATGGLLACWPWTGNRGANGYGILKREGVRTGAHRISLELSLGRPIGRGLQACHTCDNPICVNPGHLYEGTASDNMYDRWSHGAGRRRVACA